MATISSYTYREISTFGGSRDSEFIMVVSPNQNLEDEQQRGNTKDGAAVGGGSSLNRNTNGGSGAGLSSSSRGDVVKTEKLVFTMAKLQVHVHVLCCNTSYILS